MNVRRTKAVDYRNMASCLDEEEYYTEEEDEEEEIYNHCGEFNHYSNLTDEEKEDQAEHDVSNRKTFTIDDFLVPVISELKINFNDLTVEESTKIIREAAPTRTNVVLPPPDKRNTDENNQKTTIHLPAKLKVMSSSISEDKMRIRYGAYYAEANSFPRKFAVSYGSGKFGLTFLLVTVLKDETNKKNVGDGDRVTEIKINGYGVERIWFLLP